MKRIYLQLLIVFFVIVAGGELFYLLTSPYTISQGYDFATGEDVEMKDSDFKTVWVKRFHAGREGVYTKYKLNYPEPVFVTVSSVSYNRLGKAYVHIDAIPVFDNFFDIVEKYSPSEKEVQEMFRTCMALYKKTMGCFKVEAYLDEREEYFKAKSAAVK